MKVKIGELKTHLSRYLRQLAEDGEPIEVCVREEPVAWLTRARAAAAAVDLQPHEQVVRGLERSGLRLSAAPRAVAPPCDFSPTPTPAGDRRTDSSTVTDMRARKDY